MNLKPVPDDSILDDWMASILIRLPDRFNRLIQENMEASEDDIE